MSDPLSSNEALRLENVVRVFNPGPDALRVLDGANLVIERGTIVALVGPSGAGKSTLLHIAGLLENPDSGDVVVGGRKAGALSDHERTVLRRDTLGFVYQYHHLLPEFSALENVVLPQMIKGVSRKQAEIRGMELLSSLGLEARARHRPGQLSGGEQQRTAIARALANGPSLLLADEPTGNLDPHTAETVFDALMKLVREVKLAALVATHNPELAKRMDRVTALSDGKLVDL
ncbi:lipoprotein-releasing system ATP-binding protein LolD 1 [Alphaproteobacteria bacterium]|nr:lipoprotein-releasing system ATP-binding protein LolD 1 [Alphaproteobacteria bacterium]